MIDAPALSREETGLDAGLFLCDKEIARRLGVSADRWRQARKVLESQGLPPRDELMGGRYWPAVKAFFDRRHGIAKVHGSLKPDGEENLDAL